MKALKITISGSYRTAKGDVVDFEDVTGIIPKVDEDLAIMHVQSRYSVPWIKLAKNKKGDFLYPQRVDTVRQVFVDDITDYEIRFSYLGKDIKAMSYIELQDVATANDLRKVPLPKELSGVSLREIRQQAYLSYSDIVLGKFIDVDADDFNFSKLPPIIVDDSVHRDTSGKITNDEIISGEQDNRSTSPARESYTIADLKKIADGKGINYHSSIGFDALHTRLFGGAS